MDRRALIVGAAASVVASPASAEDAEARFRDALERIALLDEADGHYLAVRHAFRAVAIACIALGNKHPSQVLVEREDRLKRGRP